MGTIDASIRLQYLIDSPFLTCMTSTDPELQWIVSHPDSTSLTLEQVPLPSNTLTLVCDTSTGKHRPMVTPSMRRQVFDNLHSMSHPGMKETQRLITARFVWPNIKRDVRQWTKACLSCQRAKNRHTSTPLSTFPPPSARFNHPSGPSRPTGTIWNNLLTVGITLSIIESKKCSR